MRNILVTSALPYANGPIHIGHLVEYLQTDIWVRFQKLAGNRCLYFCADDTHGTPIMIRSKEEGVRPEDLIERVHKEHERDFVDFHVEFDNYYSTHSAENKELSTRIYRRAHDNGAIVQREVEQAYCEHDKMWLPDRYIVGTCPRCGSDGQYGDSCDICGAHYSPLELKAPACRKCGRSPVRRKSVHYFFRLADYEEQLKELANGGYVQRSVINKLQEWFDEGLRDWDISRDGPYFGFKIPGEDDKYFYVWLDAPVGYMASCKNYCDREGLDFDSVWNGDDWELYHFIGKDIMYFHALFWPAMLMSSGFRVADKLFVHGFLTVNGQKMSKSKGTFIMARTYVEHLDPEYLRYYYACKLTSDVGDIDLNFDDFLNRVNSDLVGKLANMASRSGPMITGKLDSMLGKLDDEGRELVESLSGTKEIIMDCYEGLDYSRGMREISRLADKCNRYIDDKQPWVTIKNDAESTRSILTAVINSVKILTIYIKPVLPRYAEKVERFLGTGSLGFADVEDLLEERAINKFERLIERVDKEKVEEMIEDSKQPEEAGKEGQSQESNESVLDEPIAPECTIDDFMKVDLRVAKVLEASDVEGADKLLALKLDIGGVEKNVFAGIAKAYNPDELVGRKVICVANLKPRKMKFGLSEGMVCASGPGGSEVFLLDIDEGAKPGQRVH
jgi:methionyl-tRNA synthetase